MEYKYGMDGSVSTEIETAAEEEHTYKNQFQIDFELRYFGFGGGDVGTTGHERSTLTSESTVRTDTDDAYSAFRLEDPDQGDYFVVQVFFDPHYGTPLFYTNGGASMCHWEEMTGHRSSPTITAIYIGPDTIAEDQAALFSVTLSNTVNYYENTPRDLDRPLWNSEVDLGYNMPGMALSVDYVSLAEGLVVQVNGNVVTGSISFGEFGKGSHTVLVAMYRGPIEYLYPGPVLTFAQECAGCPTCTVDPTGESSAPAALNMPSSIVPAGHEGIVYMQPCAAAAWSGDLLADQTFQVSATGSATVGFAAYNPELPVWSDNTRLEAIEFQHRASGCVGSQCWQTSDSALDYSGGAQYVDGTWLPPAEDGVYDVRLRTVCTSTGSSFYDYRHSPVLSGLIDRAAPRVVSVSSSSLDNTAERHDLVSVLFTEDIVCDG